MARLADIALAALVAAAVLISLPASALAASATPTAVPTATARPRPSPTAAKPSVTPTRVPPTATLAPAATATAQPTAAPRAQPTPSSAPAQAPVATPAAAPAVTPPSPSPVAPAAVTLNAGVGALHGIAFLDANADGQRQDTEALLANVDIMLTYPNGLARTVRTDDTGAFTFDGLASGAYRVQLMVPTNFVATTDAGQELEVTQDADISEVRFGLITTEAAGLSPDGTAPDPSADDEQIIALASVTSLPLRFAEGRDLMAQVQKRVLGEGLIWLGIPFRSQMDGGDFQYVNCGPASLTMVLAGFGLEVGPSQVRDYLNNIIDNFDRDLGTSLDVLLRIGKDAGLTPMDLYSDRGGYRNWSTDAVRWHVQQGHPVITLVKYRNLPGHTTSLSQFDHYIVITGLTPNGFIYNDAAFASTLGYGLEISDVELEYAWENSSIPHHALALGLAPDQKALTFPELPRKPRTVAPDVVAPARGVRRLAAADEVVRAPLLLTPVISATTTAAAIPMIGERWSDDPNFDAQPLPDPGSPMGLNMEPSDQPTLEPRPGPGTEVPKLLTLIGAAWGLWIVWSFAGRLALRLPSISALRCLIVAAFAWRVTR